MPYLYVRPMGGIARLADAIMLPFMRRTARHGESPQLTHFWNHSKMHRAATKNLDRSLMVACTGDPTAPRRKWRIDLRFHVGAWRQSVVLQPASYRGKWYVGWQTATDADVSRIPISNRVRMLIGPDDVEFFGIAMGTNEQIELRRDEHPHGEIPLH